MRKILVTGALGQIGQELVPALRKRYGGTNVVASDIRSLVGGNPTDGPFEVMDCTDLKGIQRVVRKHDVGVIYHLAALLSAVAEDRPQAAWHLNMDSLILLLETARSHSCALFFPSSIGAFGPTTPRDNTPQDTVQRPTTMYGVTKVAGELLCDYYAQRFGVDARGLRFPGLVSHVAMPGGGTTDYSVEIFYRAIREQHYDCPLGSDTRLDMMYMPDAVRAMIELMEADLADLDHRNAFNVTPMSITPEELAAEIREHIPDFSMTYKIDPVRQAIADSWPRSLDDSVARSEWGWAPRYDLSSMTADMLEKLYAKLGPTTPATRP